MGPSAALMIFASAPLKSFRLATVGPAVRSRTGKERRPGLPQMRPEARRRQLIPGRIQEALTKLRSNLERGLTQEEAASRLKQDGPNAIEESASAPSTSIGATSRPLLPKLQTQTPYRSEFGVEDEFSEEVGGSRVSGFESTRLTSTRAIPLLVRPIFSAARFDRSRLRLPA